MLFFVMDSLVRASVQDIRILIETLKKKKHYRFRDATVVLSLVYIIGKEERHSTVRRRSRGDGLELICYLYDSSKIIRVEATEST